VKFGFRPNLAKQIKASIEPKITDDTKATFAVKLEKKTLDPIIEAVKKRDSRGFRNALLAAFESTIKTTYKWGNISVVPEAGLELSKTPLIIKVAGSFEHRIPIDGATFKGKFTVKAGFNVGLSPQGWAWVAERVGAEAVKDFLVSSGERAMLFIEEWLLTEGVLTAGVVVAGALIGTLGLTCFMAWVTEDARHKGELEGLSTWYVSAYANRVFGDPTPSGFIVGDVALRDKLIDLGQRDAVQDARTYLRSVRDPAAAGSDQIALEAFRRILLVNDKNNYSTAKWRLQKSVEERAKKLAGL